MKLISGSQALARSPMPNGPVATVLLGGTGDSDDVGMIRVDVSPGAAMPPHRHHGSDVILTAVSGAVRISEGDDAVDVGNGDAVLVCKDELVGLSNPHDEPARLLVAAGPADFVDAVRRWPSVQEVRSSGDSERVTA